MSVVQFRKAARQNVSSGSSENVEDDLGVPMAVMFDSTERHFIALLHARALEANLFRDISLFINKDHAVYSFKEHADLTNAMSIWKLRRGEGYIYQLRREDMPDITRDNFKDIYDLARGDIDWRCGVETPDMLSTDKSAKMPFLSVVEP